MAGGPLIEAARACCVQVMGSRPGAGFFVAPATLVTCAHVIGSSEVGDTVKLRRWLAAGTEDFDAEVLVHNAGDDIAILRSSVACELYAPLGGEPVVGDPLIGIGFPHRGGRDEFDQFSSGYEGQTWFRQATGAETAAEEKFKDGQVEPGFSGGPLLNLNSGAVIGMTVATRDRSQALGGWAIRSALLQQYLRAAGVTPEPSALWPAPNHRVGVEVPFQAPSLPRHHVERGASTRSLLSELEKEDAIPGALPICLLHGTGGIGKTTLASAIAWHPRMRARFPDGVLWVELGQEPHRTAKLSAWAVAIAGASAAELSEDACIGLLRTALHTKACLLVVDNVWEAEHLRPFLVGGPRCTVLVTARRATIADEIGAAPLLLGDLELDEAIHLVRKRAPALAWDEPKTVQAITDLLLKVEGIALAVELIGSLLNRGLSLREVERHLAQPRSQSSVSSSAMRTLEQCFALSSEFLRRDDPESWNRFIRLGLIPTGAQINSRCCGAIWNVDSEDAERSLWRLADDALLSRSGDSYRLHDLLRDFALNHVAREAPDGLGTTSTALHAQIVRGYAARVRDNRWDLLEPDGYVHENLFWHVVQSGDAELAREIVWACRHDGQLAWYVAREQLGERAGYVADIRTALRMFAAQGSEGVSSQLLCALVVASIRSVNANLSPRVLEALVTHGAWSALTSFFGILQHEMDDHGIQLLTAFARGLDRRANIAPIEAELSARLRTQALKLSLEALEGRNWSVRTGNLLGVVITLLPPEDAERVAKRAMARTETLSHKIEFIKYVPQGARATFAAVINKEILSAPELEDRIRMMSRFLAYMEEGGRKSATKQIARWLRELVKSRFPVQGRFEQVRAGSVADDATVAEDAASGADDPVAFVHTGSDRMIAESQSLTSDLPNDPPIASADEADEPLSSAFIRDLSEAFNFLAHKEMKEVESLLGRCVIAPGASEPLARLRHLLSLSEITPSTDPRSTLESAIERADYREALRLIGARSADPAADFDRVVDKLSYWTRGEMVAAQWLPIWLTLAPENKLRTARRLAERFPRCLGPQAMLAVSQASGEADVELLSELIKDVSQDDREPTQLVCVSLGNSVIAQLALTRLVPIDDAEDQAGAVVALMPFLPRDFPPDLLDPWQDSGTAGARSATLVKVMSDLIHAISAGALVDVLESSMKRESEWWLVEALTSTMRRVQRHEEFQSMLDASRHITAFDLRARLIGRLALRAADFGHSELALASAAHIPEGPARWDHCRELAQHFASVGAEAEARRAAADISSSSARSHAYALVAVQLAAQGLWEAADQVVADEVVDPTWRHHAQEMLANRGGSVSSDPSAAADRLQNRRVTEPSPSDVQRAMAIVEEALGPHYPSTPQSLIARSDPAARKAQVLGLWTQPMAGGQLAAELLAMQVRPALLKRIGELAPLIGMISATSVTETIVGIGISGRTWI